MRAGVAALKKKVTDSIGGYGGFRIAATHDSTPIILLQRDGVGDLYNDLMEVGIQTEPGFFFGLEEDANAVRLRAPSPKDFDLFCAQWAE